MAKIIITVESFDYYYLDDELKKRLEEAVSDQLWIRSGISDVKVSVEFEQPEFEEMGDDL